MICERCGRETDRRIFHLTKIGRVTHKIQHGRWLCPDCLKIVKAREKGVPPTKPKPATITQEEYEWAEEMVKSFKCPIRRNPFRCDGRNCPRRPEPRCYYGLCDLGGPSKCKIFNASCFDDYRGECLSYVEAFFLLEDVALGRVKVKWGSGVKVELRPQR